MQGDTLFPVLPSFFLTEENSFQNFSAISIFHLKLCFFCFYLILFSFFFWSFCFIVSVRSFSHSICSHGAGSATQCPQPLALTCLSPREVLWFLIPVLLVGPACPPLALALVWVGLCPFGRATFIGWCPLEPPR